MTSVFKDQYPDTYALGQDNMKKAEELIPALQSWKEERFSEQLFILKNRLFDEDLRTALIIATLEEGGFQGLPEPTIINTMFTLMEDMAVLVMHHLSEENIHI